MTQAEPMLLEHESRSEVQVAEKATALDEGDSNIASLCGLQTTIAYTVFLLDLCRACEVNSRTELASTREEPTTISTTDTFARYQGIRLAAKVCRAS